MPILSLSKEDRQLIYCLGKGRLNSIKQLFSQTVEDKYLMPVSLEIRIQSQTQRCPKVISMISRQKGSLISKNKGQQSTGSSMISSCSFITKPSQGPKIKYFPLTRLQLRNQVQTKTPSASIQRTRK